MGEEPGRRKDEVAALRLGIELGMTHVDTAEMYGDGGAERVVGEAIAGQRDRVFLASKVLPSNASRAGTIRACEASLRRLGTDHLDLYLLHWWSDRHPIEETMAGNGGARPAGADALGRREQPRREPDAPRAGRARGRCRWPATRCSTTCGTGTIEQEVLPHCERKRVAVVGYTPLARGGYMKDAVAAIARRHGRTPRQVALNFLTRRPALFTIPKASRAGARAGERGRAGLHADARGGAGDRWRGLRGGAPRRRRRGPAASARARPTGLAAAPAEGTASGGARHGASAEAPAPAGAGERRRPPPERRAISRRRAVWTRPIRSRASSGSSSSATRASSTSTATRWDGCPRRAGPRLRQADRARVGRAPHPRVGGGVVHRQPADRRQARRPDRRAGRTTSSCRTRPPSTCSSWRWRRFGRGPAAAPWSPTS